MLSAQHHLSSIGGCFQDFSAWLYIYVHLRITNWSSERWYEWSAFSVSNGKKWSFDLESFFSSSCLLLHSLSPGERGSGTTRPQATVRPVLLWLLALSTLNFNYLGSIENTTFSKATSKNTQLILCLEDPSYAGHSDACSNRLHTLTQQESCFIVVSTQHSDAGCLAAVAGPRPVPRLVQSRSFKVACRNFFHDLTLSKKLFLPEIHWTEMYSRANLVKYLVMATL